MDKKHRINEAFIYLKSRGIVHTQKDIALAMGASASNVSSALKGVDNVLTDSFLSRFNKAFNSTFSEHWLLTGEGEMLSTPSSSTPNYESVKDRILQYILYKGITKKAFELNSGLSNGYLNSLREKPSEAKLQSIYKAFPDINPVWLLSGVGDMLIEGIDNMNRNERFKYLVAMLKKGGYIRNQKDLGIMMGYNNESAFSQVINGKAVEPKDFTERLKVLFPIINVGWLNCGDGDVFISEGDQSPSAVVDTSDPPPEGTKQVHYFPDIEATGGNKQLFEDYSERAINLAIPRNFDADFALPLAGDSMTPLYQPGSIILVKRWQERFIEYGKVYLIITTQGNRMVKYLRAAERNEEVLCVSENSAYDPFTIPREDILALYMVKGCIFQHSL